MKGPMNHDNVDLEWYKVCLEKAKEDYRQAIHKGDSQEAERIKTIVYLTGNFNLQKGDKNSDEQIFAKIEEFLNEKQIN